MHEIFNFKNDSVIFITSSISDNKKLIPLIKKLLKISKKDVKFAICWKINTFDSQSKIIPKNLN